MGGIGGIAVNLKEFWGHKFPLLLKLIFIHIFFTKTPKGFNGRIRLFR